MKTLRKTGRKFKKYSDLVYVVGDLPIHNDKQTLSPYAPSRTYVSILEVCKLASSIADVELCADTCTTYCCTDKLTHLWRLDNVIDVFRELSDNDSDGDVYSRLTTILLYQVRLTYNLCIPASDYDEVVFEEI